MGIDNIFGKHQFLLDDTKTIELNNSLLFIKRKKEGWCFFTSEKFSEETPDFSKGDYFHTGKSNSLIIIPALPEKPLVFKGNMLKVSPGYKLSFFLKIPVTLQFYYSKNQPENLMKEVVSKQLSNTWFGEPDDGEPALAMENEYYFEFEEVETSQFEAICPVTITNNSAALLEVKRLIIRTENLAIYRNGDKKVTSSVNVELDGQDTISPAKYRYSKIYSGEEYNICVKPKNTNDKSLFKINKHFIKNIHKNN